MSRPGRYARGTGAAVTVCVLLAGCEGSLAYRDSVTSGAGSAVRGNAVAHRVHEPRSRVENVHIESDGERVSGVIERYRAGETAPAAGAPAPLSGLAGGGR